MRRQARDWAAPEKVYLVVAEGGGAVLYASWSLAHTRKEAAKLNSTLPPKGRFVVIGPYTATPKRSDGHG